MKPAVVLALLCAVACRKPAPPDAAAGVSPSEAVAVSRGGAVSIVEVERTLRAGPPLGTDEATVLAAYRRTAEDAVVKKALLAGVGDLEAAAEALGSERGRLLREEVVEAWIRGAVGERIEISAAEIAAFYEANRERFRVRPRRFAWHLFKRHEDPARPERTRALVDALRARARKGEAFGELAKLHSDSETRTFGGQLGWLEPGRLPKRLDESLFALRAGETSEPISVSGGFVLLHVSDHLEEKRLSLADVRSGVAATLATERRRRAVAEALVAEPVPAGALILEPEAVVGRLQELGDEDVILEVADERVTAGELRARLAEAPAEPLPPADPEERVRHLYGDLASGVRLFRRLRRIGYPPPGPETEALRERLRRRAEALLVSKALEERIWRRVDSAEDDRRRFFEDNRFLYQTPLRVKLRALAVPAGEAPTERSRALARLRDRLQARALGLEAAAREAGGAVEDLGWLGPAQLAAVSPKVRAYVLELNGTGFTVPFHLDRRLLIVEVEAREEPRPLRFEEAAPRLRRDYFERSAQRLYREAVEEVLREERFEFREEVVRRSRGASRGTP